jgi:hypothetical protein
MGLLRRVRGDAEGSGGAGRAWHVPCWGRVRVCSCPPRTNLPPLSPGTPHPPPRFNRINLDVLSVCAQQVRGCKR